MLTSPRWAHLANVWDEHARNELVQAWHDLDGKPRRHPVARLLTHHSVRGHCPGARRAHQVRDRRHLIEREL